MALSKHQISSPLEAGRSILDTHNLPPHLTGTLEYASKRLARKGLHVTLIVVKNEYQLPNARVCGTPTSPPRTPESSVSGLASPSRFTYPVVGLRQLVRRGTNGSLSSNSSAYSSSSSSSSSSSASETALTSPAFPPSSAEPMASPRRWILPLTPGSPFPMTPMTPHTPSSIATVMTGTSTCTTSHPSYNTEPFGVRLIYALPISPKDEKTVRATMAKAERRFLAGRGRLPAVMSASTCGVSNDLVRRSIQQNEVLFSSEGLTLLGLDRLYSFKAALAAYAKSVTIANQRMHTMRSPGLSEHPVNPLSPTPAFARPDSSRLEDAVDCLRRLVLSNGGRPLAKANLYCSFDWMLVNTAALADVEKMYRRAYGGPEQRGPFEAPSAPKNPEDRQDHETAIEEKRAGFVKIGTPPPPKAHITPILKLNTNITITSPQLIRPKPRAIPQDSDTNTKGPERKNNDDDGDRTPHPLRDGPVVRPSIIWPGPDASSASIDQLLSPYETTASRHSQRLGPITPNGYDDISPITRGEWGFLFKGDTWTRGRTAVVETF